MNNQCRSWVDAEDRLFDEILPLLLDYHHAELILLVFELQHLNWQLVVVEVVIDRLSFFLSCLPSVDKT